MAPDLIWAVRYARWARRVGTWMAMRPAELERFQSERLRAVVAHAYAHVELYRRKWRQAGVTPDDVKTLADLSKLPVITRDDFRHSTAGDILSRRHRPHQCFEVGTSGSSGSPMTMFVDTDKALLDFSVNLPQHMARCAPVTVTAVLRDLFLRRGIRYMAIVVDEPHARVFWQMRHTRVNSLCPPVEHVTAINRKRPICLMTYPSVLRNICLAVKRDGLEMHQPELIMLSGEVVDPPLRQLIASVFRGTLMDVYGTTEAGFIAAECPAQAGQHVLAWKAIIELLGEDGREVPPGEPGKVVITDLFNRATPIIRYAGLGDYAVRKTEPCSCGRSLPLLARVEGRTVDSVVLPNGALVHPYRLTLALEDIPHVSKFQIRQEARDHIRVLLVKDTVREAAGASFDRDSHLGRTILGRFDRILDRQVRVDLQTVTDIPRRPGSHKFATVLSLVEDR